MKAAKETVLAIIPAYCEERFIGRVVREVLEHVNAALVVDDGSTDRTSAEAEAAGAQVIRHSTNLGKGAALKTGLRCAVLIEADFFLFLDGDGQHDPAEIPAQRRDGPDVAACADDHVTPFQLNIRQELVNSSEQECDHQKRNHKHGNMQYGCGHGQH